MSELLNEDEKKKARAADGRFELEEGMSDDELDRVKQAVADLASRKDGERGFYIVAKMVPPDVIQGMAALVNVNKAEVLDTVLATLEMDDSDLMKFIGLRLQARQQKKD